MPDRAPSAIEATALTKSYGDLVAVEPLDLQVPQRQRLVLIGHNGSGKTTLLRMAAGLLEPSSGEITIEGAPAGTLDARANLSYLPDTPVLYDDLSVWEHAEYISRLHAAGSEGRDDWEGRTQGLLEALELTERADDLPSRFSRGMRQKTAILLALVRPFSVLIVDEPFVGLDPAGQGAFVELLDEAGDAGATVIVATHQLDFARQADRCVALSDGSVIFDGPPNETDMGSIAG